MRGYYTRSQSRQPSIRKIDYRRLADPIPTKPGRYFWSEYGQVVELTRKRGGKHLYVIPPIAGAIQIRVTNRIAGSFVPHPEGA